MLIFKEKFIYLHGEQDLVNIKNIGAQDYLWDYSLPKSYYQNMLKMASFDPEGQAMRLFYKIDSNQANSGSNRLIKDEGSCLINCNILSGKVQNSVLIDVESATVEAQDSVIISSNSKMIKTRLSLLYKNKSSLFYPSSVSYLEYA